MLKAAEAAERSEHGASLYKLSLVKCLWIIYRIIRRKYCEMLECESKYGRMAI